jgi:hypothetical protein
MRISVTSIAVSLWMAIVLTLLPARLSAQVDQESVEEVTAAGVAEAVADSVGSGNQNLDEELAVEDQVLRLALWSGDADLSMVVAEGNSTSESLGFESTLRRRSEFSLFRFRLQATQVDSADDRFRQLVPGVRWLPGAGPPPDAPTTLVKPASENDVERYLVEARLESDVPSGFGRRLPGFFRWHAGVTWDSNRDAGIVGRTIAFAGLGHTWWDFEDLHFRSSYGLSWTERREEKPDPEKEDSFPGWRLDWDFMKKFGREDSTSFEHSWVVNGNFIDSADYSMEMVNALSVAISDRLALRVSLQWLYNNEPALEDIDVVVQSVIVDPDGVPGSGDEFFETVGAGGITATVSEVRERKEPLDTVFRTSLVWSF